MPVDGLSVEQPAQEGQPVVDDIGAIEHLAGRDQRFGQRGVGVRQSRFGPGPIELGRQRSDRRDRVGEQVAGAEVAVVVFGDLGGAERRERHRPAMR